MSLGSQFVIRMDLYGQIILCINILKQQRKLNTELFKYMVSNKVTHIYFNKLLQVISGQDTIFNNRDTFLDT